MNELGTDKQKEPYLQPLLRAQTKCSFGLTEPDVGSDLASLTSYAEKAANGYVLNGSKIFINNGPVCDFALVLARSREGGNRHSQMSIFIVDADRPGFSRGTKEHKMGQRASQLSSLFLKIVSCLRMLFWPIISFLVSSLSNPTDRCRFMNTNRKKSIMY
ncbi:MAG: acyl-CoA dehydrogenase [Desulfobacterales bacterium]